MKKQSNKYNRIESALRAVLPTMVAVEIVNREEQGLILKVAGRRLRVLWIEAGWPRQIKDLLVNQHPRPNLVIAPQLSLGARQMLANEKIGWVDEFGSAEFAVGTIIVSRSGRMEKPPVKPKGWTPATLAVAEALLCNKNTTVEAITGVTGLSTGSCVIALKVLTDKGLLVADAKRGRKSSRRIVDKNQLLEAYASAAATFKPRISLVAGATWRDLIVGLGACGRQWNKSGIAWATTGLVAASVLAPSITNVTSSMVYVAATTPSELETIAIRGGLRPIEGGRVTLLPFPTIATERLCSTIGGLQIAPWPRVFADLRTVGVRGEEAAEHLREIMYG